MVKGLIGVKRGMTQLFDDQNRFIPCTVLEVGPCRVLQLKTKAKDGYEAAQLGFKPYDRKNVRRDVAVRCEKLGVPALRHYKEFELLKTGQYPELAQELTVTVFEGTKLVDVQGTTIGRGFQGCIKRHGFHRGKRSHGSTRHRNPGSIGNNAWPSEVMPGRRMPGRYGGDKQTQRNLTVVRVDAERNLLFVRGAVPGCDNGLVYIYKVK